MLEPRSVISIQLPWLVWSPLLPSLAWKQCVWHLVWYGSVTFQGPKLPGLCTYSSVSKYNLPLAPNVGERSGIKTQPLQQDMLWAFSEDSGFRKFFQSLLSPSLSSANLGKLLFLSHIFFVCTLRPIRPSLLRK